MCLFVEYEGPECIREPNPARWDPDPAICRNHDASKTKPAGCFMEEPPPPNVSVDPRP